MINPDFIKTFVELSRQRNFTQTARRLHMTQPGVSQHLQKLEQHFGTRLVERDKSDVVLTEAGRKLLEFGLRLEKEHSSLQQMIAADNPYEGRVRMSSPGSFGLLIFDVMIECAKKHPALRVDLVASPSSEIARRVIDDEVDVGYATVPSQDPRINCEKFHTESLVIVTPQGCKPQTLEDYKRLGLIWHPDMPYLMDRVFDGCDFLDYRGIDDFPIRASVNQMNRIIDPIEAGLGFSILPGVSVHYYKKGRKVRTVEYRGCEEEQIYRLTLKRRALPKRVEYVEAEFLKALKRISR